MREHYNSRYDVWCTAMALLKLWGVQLPQELGRYKYNNWRQWTADNWAHLLAKEMPEAPEVQHFLCVMLHPTPELRPKASQLLEHPLIETLLLDGTSLSQPCLCTTVACRNLASVVAISPAAAQDQPC